MRQRATSAEAQVETLQGERDQRDATVRETALDLESQIQQLQAERDAAFTLPVLLLEGSVGTPDYYSQRTSFERDLYQLWVRLKIRLERADATETQLTALRALLRLADRGDTHSELVENNDSKTS